MLVLLLQKDPAFGVANHRRNSGHE